MEHIPVPWRNLISDTNLFITGAGSPDRGERVLTEVMLTVWCPNSVHPDIWQQTHEQ